jgi:hypothetical protein
MQQHRKISSKEVAVQTLFRPAPTIDEIRRLTCAGMFKPCPSREPLPHVRVAQPEPIPEHMNVFVCAGTNLTNCVQLQTGGIIAVEDLIQGYIYDAVYCADYSYFEPVVATNAAAPLLTAKEALPRRVSSEEQENVVEFRTLPPRIEGLSSVRGNVHLRSISGSLAAESQAKSPRVETDLEFVPE